MANAAAKKAGPTAGQGNHYVNRQNLCTHVQKTQENILRQIQIVEAQPGNAGNRRQQDLSGHTVTTRLRDLPPPRMQQG
eukprot:16440913-Heterocapsa_arctica.AAC.1